MQIEKVCFRAGVAALALALCVRLGSSGVLGAVANALSSPKAMEIIFFLETGKILRPVAPAVPTEPTAETVPAQQPEPPAQAVFSQTDAALVDVNNYSGKTADVVSFLQKPLDWQLKQAQPTVLILHTHGTESYTKNEDYKETSKYRTENTSYNVVSVGTRLAQALEAGGIKVIHDTFMHDAPSYNDSYSHARTATKKNLKENPSVSLVLDIHRDAVEDKQGNQAKLTVETTRGTAAKLMLVVGTDAQLSHADWPENMAVAVKLHALLEKKYPGICRPISFRSQRFNQDLSPGALIVEVGAAGNDRQEALLSAQILAEAVLELAQGAVTEDSTR